MKKLDDTIRKMRASALPKGVNAAQWASAINWNVEVWKCYLNQQKWVHQIRIYCPEQFALLFNEKRELIIDKIELLQFENTEANKLWMIKLNQLIADMRAKGEYTEALHWVKIVNAIAAANLPTPNEDLLVKQKGGLKGHKLIRIKTAA